MVEDGEEVDEVKAVVVRGPNSRLAGARCRACPAAVRAGQVVLYQRIPVEAPDDNRFVVHVDCVSALIARAPEGDVPRNPVAELDRIRRDAIARGAA